MGPKVLALQLSTTVHHCPQLSMIAYNCRQFVTELPLRKGPKRAKKVYNCRRLCAQIAESGLDSPHLDFPENGPFLEIRASSNN